MAGIIKRSNKWVAVFKTLDGKEVRKTTRIDVVPKVIPPGANKRAVIAQNEARARLIAEELELDTRPALLTRSGSKLSLAEMFRRPALAERP